MEDNNITELFKEKTTTPEEVNWNYTIKFKDGTEDTATGYVVINQLFIAVAQGNGILQKVWPVDTYSVVINNGPVATGTALN